MSAIVSSLRDGGNAVRRNPGLALLVLLVNAALAALLAVPLARALERDLLHTGASTEMMYGFDHGWWQEWSERQTGWTASFAPDILGLGFAAKNLDLLLQGRLPLGLFAEERGDAPDDGADGEGGRAVDPVILGLAGLYLLIHALLTGGLLGVFRAPEAGWTFRGLAHGSGFYAGRVVRVTLTALLLAGVLFALHAPLAHWTEERAREAMTETTALAWSLARLGLLFLALMLVHAVSSFAKVVIVVEERSSALLAVISAAGFCARHLWRVLAQYAAVGALGLGMLLVWGFLDLRLAVVGYKTQLLFLVLAEAFVLARVGLRLSLLAGQVSLYRRLRGAPVAAL
jgi:hypothetical protein